MYVTESYSLDFWLRMQVRLAAAFTAGRKRLTEFRDLSYKASIDDADLGRKRASAARADALNLLEETEGLRVLMNDIERQIRPVFSEAGLPELLSRMSCIRDVLEMYQTSILSLPNRLPAEEDLTDFERRHASLKNAGNGDATVADRERLRTQNVNLRALGREDVAKYEAAVLQIETSLDHMVAQVQQIKTRTYLAVNVAEQATKLLAGFGIKIYETPDPQTEAGAADGAGSEAQATGEAATPADTDERREPQLPETVPAADEGAQA
jgi:hypothetical protein